MQRWSDQGDSWMSGHVGSDDHKLCSLDVFGLHSNLIKCEGLFVRSLLGNLLGRFVCCAKVGKSFAHCLLCQVLAYHGRTSWFSPRRQPQMWRRMPCWPCCTASMLDGGTEEILRTTRHMQKEYANTEEWWFGFHFAFSLFAWMSLAATLHVWRCLGIKTWDHAFATSFFFRNYLITEIAETERRQWFKELLLLDDFLKTGKTVWIGSDFQVQGRTGHWSREMSSNQIWLISQPTHESASNQISQRRTSQTARRASTSLTSLTSTCTTRST